MSESAQCAHMRTEARLGGRYRAGKVVGLERTRRAADGLAAGACRVKAAANVLRRDNRMLGGGQLGGRPLSLAEATQQLTSCKGDNLELVS